MRTPPTDLTPAARLRRMPPGASLAAGLALTALAAAGDAATGTEVSFLLFYFPGVALSAWSGGRERGLVVAAAAALGWLAVEMGSGQTYSHAAVPYWNGSVRLAIFVLVAGAVAYVRDAADREAQLRETDPETGATRSSSFYHRLEEEHEALASAGAPLTLVYVEVEGVPPAPDPNLDPVLVALRSVVRRTDLIARPRGKEFAILLSDTTPRAAARALERIAGALSRMVAAHGAVGAVGAVTCTGEGSELTTIIQRAYQLMYAAERKSGEVSLQHETQGGAAAGSAPRREPAGV